MSAVAKLLSAELEGISAELVEVEADINVGLHSFSIVGLADKSVSEAKERVNSALKNSGIKPPTRENRRITINLAPADTKKAGSRFDLAIALAYLLASEQIKPFDATHMLFVGELSLNGDVRPINGAINIALLAREQHITHLFVPQENAEEASAVSEITIIPVKNIRQIIAHLEKSFPITPHIFTNHVSKFPHNALSLDDVKGNASAKRAFVIAAAGNHHLLMSGPPGTGKSMLAEALNSILPPPSNEECLEITKIWSATNVEPHISYHTFRPFRAPHHSASLVSIIGGGTNPKPGEVSLAHRGVLFLDELPEFHRDVIEALRQPLEKGEVHIARAKKTLILPSRFMLVSAMNPCPCGYFEDTEHECRCSAYEVLKYQKKISGPLLDRIDIHITVPRMPLETLRIIPPVKEVEVLRERIIHARSIQEERFKTLHPRVVNNAEMSSRQTDLLVNLTPQGESFLKHALEHSFLSPRGYYRILKVSRTIADLDSSDTINERHLAEAFQYRLKTGE